MKLPISSKQAIILTFMRYVVFAGSADVSGLIFIAWTFLGTAKLRGEFTSSNTSFPSYFNYNTIFIN